VVKLLLDAGADPTISGKSGVSALHTARDFGHHEVVRLVQVRCRGGGTQQHENAYRKSS